MNWSREAIEAADAAFRDNQSVEDSFDFWKIVLDAAIDAQRGLYDAEDLIELLEDGELLLVAQRLKRNRTNGRSQV